MSNTQNNTFKNGFYYSKYTKGIHYIRNGNVSPMSRVVDANTCLNELELFSTFHPNSVFATIAKPLLLTDVKDHIPLGKQFPELFI